VQPISTGYLMWMQNHGPPGDVGGMGLSLVNYWLTEHSAKDSIGLPITGIPVPPWRRDIPEEVIMPVLI